MGDWETQTRPMQVPWGSDPSPLAPRLAGRQNVHIPDCFILCSLSHIFVMNYSVNEKVVLWKGKEHHLKP